MQISVRLLPLCALLLVSVAKAASAQGVTISPQATASDDGVYDVPASEMKKLESSPKVQFPRELSNYEIADSVTVALTISPEGKVKKATVVSGKFEPIREAARKTISKWSYQPFLVNGEPVSVRTQVTLDFDNTFDHYRDLAGNVPARLDENAARALLIKAANPIYPPAALGGRIQGAVILRVIVGQDGHVSGLHIVRGHPMLAPAAYNAVRNWEFRPYFENGKPMPLDTTITVMFSLR